MNKKLAFSFLILFFVALTIFIISPKTQEQEEEKNSNFTILKIGMGYIPNVQFSPFYIADSENYYAEKNLQLEFDYAMSTDLLKLLGENKYDFVIATGDEAILAVEAGIPIKYLMPLYQKFPISIVSLQEKNILTPNDLKGKTIGLPGFYGSSYIGLQAFLKENNLSEAEVNLEPIGYTQVSSLTEKKVDAVVVFSMNEPNQLKNLGYEINEIKLSDYLDFASAGIISTDQKISENPQLIKDFLSATMKAMNYATENPDEAFTICQNYIEISEDKESVQKQVMQNAMLYWQNNEDEFTSEINVGTWINTIEILKNSDLIENLADPTKYIYTFE